MGQLRAGHEDATKALLATRFFGLGSVSSVGASFKKSAAKKHDPRDGWAGARREEILLMGDLLRRKTPAASK